MKHIFLTGEVQCGKTTLIRRALAELNIKKPGGFRSISVLSIIPEAYAEVYIIPAAEQRPPLTRDNLIGIRWKKHAFNAFPQSFDNYGVKLLEAATDAPLMLMDELGMMENRAPRFAAAVLKALDGPIPVLGVVKPMSTPLLDAVRAHPAVETILVNAENRDSLVPVVVDALRPFIG